jgi:signal transduction histidine kinase
MKGRLEIPAMAAWLRDGAITVVAVALDLLLFTQLSDDPDQVSWTSPTMPAWVIIGTGSLIAIPLYFRRRAPSAVCLIIAGLSALLTLVFGTRPLVTPLIALYTAAVWENRRRALVCLTAVLAAHSVAVAYEAWFTSRPSAFAVTAVASVYLILDVAVWGLGRWGAGAAARARARALEASRIALAREAVASERLRIGRELHDIVAHAVTVMILQAAAARLAIATDKSGAVNAISSVENMGVQALNELRRLLEVLHATSDWVVDNAPNTDENRLADLEDLRHQVQASGVEVSIKTRGAPKGLDPSVDLAAYRVVQEGLTNVIKHAGPGAKAHVNIDWQNMGLIIEVIDDGAPGESVRREPVASGYGLLGLAERVKLVRGKLDFGAYGSRGFRLHAELPAGVSIQSGETPPETVRAQSPHIFHSTKNLEVSQTPPGLPSDQQSRASKQGTQQFLSELSIPIQPCSSNHGRRSNTARDRVCGTDRPMPLAAAVPPLQIEQSSHPGVKPPPARPSSAPRRRDASPIPVVDLDGEAAVDTLEEARAGREPCGPA